MNVDELFESPDQFLLAFEGKDAVFIDMDRAAYHRSVFLDGRISPRSQSLTRAPAAALENACVRATAGGEVGYIFHVAHCGSTLLARALDLPDANLVLREPMALRQLGVRAGNASLGKADDEEWKARARLLHRMFARRYVKNGPVIVKANVPVNFMIPRLSEIAPAAPAIVIYFSLEDYLVAILRSPNHRRWVDSVSSEVRHGITTLTGESSPRSTAESAALLWLAQMLIYHELLSRNARAASLNAEDLFNRPLDTVRAAFGHFGQPQTEEVIQRIVASDLFERYSKNPSVAFTNAARLERKRSMRTEIAAELAQARALIDRLPAAQKLPSRLGADLLGGGVDLLE